MKYIIFDMEWNQPLYAKMTVTDPVVLHAEIVQIGAVKLDENFNIISDFNILVAPKYYKKMHKKVQRLTKITTEELQNGFEFPKAFEMFADWCGEDFALLTWGPDDMPVLTDNMILHGIDTKWIPPAYNLQVIFDSQITHMHRQIALTAALELLNETGGDAHNALNDAKNTAIVCRHLNLSEGIASYETIAADFLSDAELCEGEYTSRKEALEDKRVTEFECPVCGKKAVCRKYVRQNASKLISICSCEDGHELFVRYKFSKNAEGLTIVKRAAYELNDEYREFYNQKIEANKSFQKYRHKKAVAE